MSSSFITPKQYVLHLSCWKAVLWWRTPGIWGDCALSGLSKSLYLQHEWRKMRNIPGIIFRVPNLSPLFWASFEAGGCPPRLTWAAVALDLTLSLGKV